MSQFGMVVREINDGNDKNGPLPCMWCQKQTARSTLSQYGARCFACYEDYCLGANPPMKGFTDGRGDTPDQAIMRRAPKANRPAGQSVAASDVLDDKAIAAAKRETARRVAEYERNQK